MVGCHQLLRRIWLQNEIYPWLNIDPKTDHALAAKWPLFTRVAFTVLVPVVISSWGLIARRFLKWSTSQDKDGAAAIGDFVMADIDGTLDGVAVPEAMSRDQLIDEVWGSDYVGDTKTLDVHVKRLRAKLEPDPANPRHLLTVRGFGYKFVG